MIGVRGWTLEPAELEPDDEYCVPRYVCKGLENFPRPTEVGPRDENLESSCNSWRTSYQRLTRVQ